MTPTCEQEQRARVVAEAQSWVGERYAESQGVRGGGIDCAYLLARVFQSIGVVPADIDLAPYKGAFARLRGGEVMYRTLLERFARPVERADGRGLPGDIAVFDVTIANPRTGTVLTRATHGAIVELWPWIIHAFMEDGRVVRHNLERATFMGPINSIWSVKGWA